MAQTSGSHRQYHDLNEFESLGRPRAAWLETGPNPNSNRPTRRSNHRTFKRRSKEKLGFLAEASLALSSSLDFDTVLATAPRLGVPSFADRCVVYVGVSPSTVEGRAACADASLVAVIEHAIKLSRLDQNWEHGLLAPVLRTGQPRYTSNVSEEQLDRDAPETELTSLLRTLTTQSLIVAPLAARGRTFGAMSFALARSAAGRCYDAADLELASDLATRCALALDNARLYDEARRAGAALQQDRSTAKLLAILSERERIAMDLHDGVIQSLYGMTLGLVAAELKIEERPDDMRQAVRRATGQIDDIIQDIRAYIFDLRDRGLGARDLRAGLEAMADRLRDVTSGQVDVRLDPRTDNLLGPVARGQLLQIAQEAVANVRRHAAAGHVSVSLKRTSTRLILTIRDDGRGFDPLATAPETSLGLRNIRERARILGGDVSIRSALGRGTEITVTIPALGQDEME